MATMLVKNALRMSLRMQPGISGMRFVSVTPSSNVSAMSYNAMSALLMTNQEHTSIRNSLVFETNISRMQIDDFLPQLDQIGELECPTERLNDPLQAIKRTYQPSVLRRKRKHGFRTRRVSISGRKVLKRRFNKGRWRMSL